MLNTLPSLATLTALMLVGASALAADVGQDCCTPKAGAAAPNASTPALEFVAGPRAAGRVTFIGDAAGKASFEGTAPEVKPLTIDAKAAAGCMPEGEAMSTANETLLISKDGGVANVVIKVMVDGAKLTVPEEPIHMDQSQCHFDPHVTVLPAGAKVAFLNSDSVSHNVHVYAKRNDSMNKTIAAGGKETQTYAKTDEIEVKCDIHPWMNSYMIVTDTPFYAVTDRDGKFSIAGMPAGTHKVEYWHEKLGKGKADIVVLADGTCEAFEIKLGGEKKGKPRR